MFKVDCQQCDGTGVVTTMEPKALGRCSNGEMVYSSPMVPMNRLCADCTGSGTVEGETEAASAVSPTPVTFGGVTVDAAGFDPEQFERAMARALADALEVHVDQSGETIVTHAGVNGGFRCSRTRCECRAGQVGTPCKHRAALIAHLDIREPALRRQWQAAERSVSRSAVAA